VFQAWFRARLGMGESWGDGELDYGIWEASWRLERGARQ